MQVRTIVGAAPVARLNVLACAKASRMAVRPESAYKMASDAQGILGGSSMRWSAHPVLQPDPETNRHVRKYFAVVDDSMSQTKEVIFQSTSNSSDIVVWRIDNATLMLLDGEVVDQRSWFMHEPNLRGQIPEDIANLLQESLPLARRLDTDDCDGSSKCNNIVNWYDGRASLAMEASAGDHHTDSDGYCLYGHTGPDGHCSAPCHGLREYECQCMNKEDAEEGHHWHRVGMIIGLVMLCACFVPAGIGVAIAAVSTKHPFLFCFCTIWNGIVGTMLYFLISYLVNFDPDSYFAACSPPPS